MSTKNVTIEERKAYLDQLMREHEESKPIISDSVSYYADFENYIRSAKVEDSLKSGSDKEGGYLVPNEYHEKLIQKLEDEHVIRKLVTVFTADHNISIPGVSKHGEADWISEEFLIADEVSFESSKVGKWMYFFSVDDDLDRVDELCLKAVELGIVQESMHWQHRFNHMVGRYNDIYRVQMPNITPHVCRHTYCSNQAKAGMNPKTLQYLMGHSDISVTMNVYTHIGFDDAEEELKRMGEFRKAQAEVEKQKEKTMSQKMFKAI